MKKLINNPEAVVEEMVEGLVAIYPGLRRLRGHTVLLRADAEEVRDRQVALISGGGSGHEPAHAGYVGPGMLSAAVAGEVFTSPSPDAVLAAIRAVAGARGALLIVKNYTGDRINFGLAAEMARAEGIAVELMVVADDVALAAAPETELTGRRGLGGAVLVHKVAGAAAEAGVALAQVAAEARAAAAAVGTMGVALSACTVPGVGLPSFELSDDEVELGLGIHGEPGVKRGPIELADVLVDRLLEPILDDLEVERGERVVLMVNNLGGTPLMELAIVARRATYLLAGRGIVLERVYAGTFLSSLEMAGVSLSVMWVDDQRLARLDAVTEAPAWPNAAARPRTLALPIGPPPAAGPDDTILGPPRTAAGQVLGTAIRGIARALAAAEPRLTALDQAVGDGDLGITLARGAEAVLDALPSIPLDDPPAALHALGILLQRVLGGTSGPLWSVFLLRAAGVLRKHPDCGPHVWPASFQAGGAGIAALGGAAQGDRTLLDALLPATEALQSELDDGHPLPRALRAAAEAAEAGAEATAQLVPRRGRASYLGPRALGHPDPGAVALAVALRALAEQRRGLSADDTE